MDESRGGCHGNRHERKEGRKVNQKEEKDAIKRKRVDHSGNNMAGPGPRKNASPSASNLGRNNNRATCSNKRVMPEW